MLNRSVVAVAVTIGLVAAVVGPRLMAQEKAPAASNSAAAANATGYAKHMKTIWGDKKIVQMDGDVKFTHKDTIITSDKVDYDDAAKIAVSPGAIKITNPECDIDATKGSAQFKEKLGIVEGNVVMLVKPKPEEAASAPKDGDNSVDKFKQPTTITCKKMEYYYAKKIANCDGEVVFKQSKRTAYADKAVYDQNTEILTLTGNVRAVDEKGQTFTSPGKIVISLKKGDEWLDASDAVNATFQIDLGEDKDKKQ